MEKLRSMDPAERRELDAKMSEALSHYHNENYGAALKLFTEIAESIESMDMMFWSGISASKLGRYDLAKLKFEAMLALDPDLARVKLEYADVLAKMGRRNIARSELESVLATSPPASVRRNIERRLALLRRKGGDVSRSSYGISAGYQYDGNITSGPDDDSILVATGTLTLPASQKEEDGSNLLLKAHADFLRDVGAKEGWLAAANFYTYNSFSDEDSKVNYNLIDVQVGPMYVSGNFLFRMPVGYKSTWYGNDHLSDTTSLNPGIKYVVSDSLSWDIGITLASEDFDQARYTNTNNDLFRLTFAPSFAAGERARLTVAIDYEQRDATSSVFSYDGYGGSVTLLNQVNDRTSAFASYRVAQKKYDAPPPLFAENRDDLRQTLTLALSHEYQNRIVTSLSWTYMLNRSNADLYDFDRNLLSLDVGINF
jgi:tetratricopeptide (TPR) repeat protein